MPWGGRKADADIERTIAICARFKRRIAAGDEQAAVIADLANEYGVLRPAIWRQVHKGLSPSFAALVQERTSSVIEEEEEPDDPGMVIAPTVWCGQCEKRVTESVASSCASSFCKAKAQAA